MAQNLFVQHVHHPKFRNAVACVQRQLAAQVAVEPAVRHLDDQRHVLDTRQTPHVIVRVRGRTLKSGCRGASRCQALCGLLSGCFRAAFGLLSGFRAPSPDTQASSLANAITHAKKPAGETPAGF